jgi:hypothetical protein
MKLHAIDFVIKFNWYGKLEKAPASIARREQPLPVQATAL